MSGAILAVLRHEARCAIVEGDCLDLLPSLPGRSVDHVICDPPYEADAHTAQRRIKTSGGGGSYGVAEIQPLAFPPITARERIASADGMARVAKRWLLAFCQVEATTPWRQAFEAGGAKYKRTAIWVKPDGQPQLSGDRPGMGYESICICHAPGRTRWNGGGRTGVFTHLRNPVGPAHGKAPHPTTKPLALMLELVELFTDPGDLVLDPFAGSGTTGVACLRLGRRFIGIERDAKYAQVARERLEAETNGLSLRDARAGQIPMFPAAT